MANKHENTYRVKVYDGGDDPFWGEVRIIAADEVDAEEKVYAYLETMVAEGDTDLDMATIKLNPMLVSECAPEDKSQELRPRM
jgi:hypothetical protein